jgi:hypothetical protein
MESEAMEKVTGPDRAVPQPVQHWPSYLPGLWVPHCALAEGLDTATGAITVTVNYQRP